MITYSTVNIPPDVSESMALQCYQFILISFVHDITHKFAIAKSYSNPQCLRKAYPKGITFPKIDK